MSCEIYNPTLPRSKTTFLDVDYDDMFSDALNEISFYCGHIYICTYMDTYPCNKECSTDTYVPMLK